jgi:arylsulfatase A-like enzyme
MKLRFLPFLLALSAGSFAAPAVRPPLPNIVFVMVDDMGHADIGPYGQRLISTPHLDRMAAEGIRFTAAYAGATVCAPARSVLMTGQHLGHTRVRDNKAIAGGALDQNQDRRVTLEAEDITVAEVLKGRGYMTGMTGKWGLAEPGTAGEPNLKGFDAWFGFLNQNHAHTHYPDYLWRDQQKVTVDANRDGRRQQHSHDLFTGFALDFIRRHTRQPFFLYVPYTLPHAEMAVPSTGSYEHKAWTEEERIHAAMIGMIDRDMGRIFGLLEELALDENTVVFFCSDNGGARRYDGRFDSNRGLRGKKGDLYEGGLRVPMLVRWPGKIPPGITSDLPWTFADVLPTLADIAGAAGPVKIDGMSVLPSLLGKPQDLERMLYWERHAGGFQQAVRLGAWKGVRRDGEPFELYNLDRDPGETRNVAEVNAAVVRRIEKLMQDAHVPSPNWPRQNAVVSRK